MSNNQTRERIRERNMRHHANIAAKLAEIGPQWSEAWQSLIVMRGKRYGLIRLQKPPHNWKGTNGRAGVLWEAWNHYRGQLSAHRLGVGPAAMSYGGAMCSLIFCNDETKADAFEVACDAIHAEMVAAQNERSKNNAE